MKPETVIKYGLLTILVHLVSLYLAYLINNLFLVTYSSFFIGMAFVVIMYENEIRIKKIGYLK